MHEKGVDLEREIKKVLVVDDEQDICALLTKYLRSSGYSCESFTDPAKALEVLRRNGLDLVISDIKMAGIDGLLGLGYFPGSAPPPRYTGNPGVPAHQL
jgi:DNA-binding NtrC family response regulator